MTVLYRRADVGDAPAISRLALDTCKKFIFADTTEAGRQTLREIYHPVSLGQRIQEGDIFVLAHSAGELAGAAAMRPGDGHVYLLFVDGRFHGQGLGRELIQALMAKTGRPRTIKLNSSLYAVDFYKHMGFKATGPISRDKGLEFLPMILELGDD